MKTFRILLVAFCAIFLATATPHAVAQAPSDAADATSLVDDEARNPPAFRFLNLDDKPELKESIRLAAFRARQQIFRNTNIDWEGTALIVWSDEQAFLAQTGHRPEHAIAAASAQRQTIWINASAWTRAEERDRQETMTHEVAHLLIGSLPGGRELPLWANEGLAMHLANQWNLEEQMKLYQARLFGQLPKLNELESRFPAGGEAQTLAYQMSYVTVGNVAANLGDDPGEVRRLMQRLADPRGGPRLAEDFSDAFVREGWQRATENSLGSRFTSGAIVLSSTGTVFLLITILVIVAFIRVKQKNAMRRREEVDDEAWAESLTEEDVQDIYGDREDRWD